MIDIIFEELSIQHFKSVGEVPVVVTFTPGINFISGYNKDEESFNGVGKTTIIDAFFFALFDKTLTGIYKTNLVNDKTNGTSIISLKYKVDDVSYEIVRSINPSRVSFTRDGVNVSKTIPETNKDICESIRGDIEVYSNSIVMNAESKGFLTKEPAKKVKFIEQILSLGVFADMLKVAQAELREYNKSFAMESGALSQIDAFIKREEQSTAKFEVDRAATVDSIRTTVDRLTKGLSDFKTVDVSDQIQSRSVKLKEIDNRLNRVSEAMLTTNMKLSQISSDIATLKKDLKGLELLNCPSCNRPMDGHSEFEIKSLFESINGKIDPLNLEQEKTLLVRKNASNAKTTLLSLKSGIELELVDLTGKQSAYESMKDEIRRIEGEITSKMELIKREESRDNPHHSNLKSLEGDKLEKDKIISELSNNLKVLENVKFLCSPEGVKSHIIFKILKSFNSKLQYYLKRFSAPCKCEFDQYFDYKLTNVEGREISYFNLSGGERKRLDLSLLFTFRELRKMQSNIIINVTMFDELFDSALDSTGIEVVLNLLKEQTEKTSECIYIVTHRKEILEEDGRNTIYLEKSGGITQISVPK